MKESYRPPDARAPADGSAGTHSIAVAAKDAARAESLARLLGALAATARIETLDAGNIASVPDARGIVVDGTSGGLATARKLRAMGYEGALVLVAQNGADEDALSEAARLGVTACPEGDELGSSMAAALASSSDHSALGAALRRATRLMAVGGVALGLQHAINNPLAALLAEAQLLEMDQLNEEQRAAARRMVELCRRVNALVRELDGISRPREG